MRYKLSNRGTNINILISNDDGIWAPGIKVLGDELEKIANISVVAPDRNCSGASTSLSIDNPLHIYEHSDGRISVEGTPTEFGVCSVVFLQ